MNYSFNSTYWTTVTVTVKDSTGKTVRTIDSQQAPSGSFSTQWDGKDSSGVPVPDASYQIVASPAGYVYSSTIGSQGSGNGQLLRPLGVGIDSSGNVWVGDNGNNRYEEFASDGTYLAQIPYAGAWTIHPESDGSLDVANFTNTVKRINADGTVIASYTEGNDPTNATLLDLQRKPGGNWLFTDNRMYCCWGQGAREVGPPWTATVAPTIIHQNATCCRTWGVADLGNGNVALTSADNATLQFSNIYNQNFWGTSNFCFPNTYGCPGLGQVPGLTSNGSDPILVLRDRNQIAELPYLSTAPLWVIGSGGPQHGQFDTPYGIALSNGKLFVADDNNNRVEVYTQAQPVSVPIIVDTHGPAVSEAKVIPNIGGGGVVTATVNDTQTGNSPITGAEIFVDTTGPDGTGQPLDAQDGTFDRSVEPVWGYLNVPLPAPSVPPSPDQVVVLHKLFIHGKDTAGNWGGYQVLNIAATPAGVVSLPF